MKNKNFIPACLCYLLLQFFVNHTSNAQDYSSIKEKADTVNFSVTKHNDWQLLNTYVSVNSKGDSVQLELVVFSDQKNINWKKEQYVGSIKEKRFLSKTDKVASYSLLNDVYQVKVKPDGKCYFTLEKGNPPAAFPIVIPFVVSYKL